MATTTPNLLSLPVEVLSKIVSEFCQHCLRPSSTDGWSRCSTGYLVAETYRPVAQTATLCALSKTCQLLRSIAQPILFHCAIAPGSRQDGDREHVTTQATASSLICALIQRPDLACKVQIVLLLDEWYAPKYWKPSPEQRIILERAWEAFTEKKHSGVLIGASPETKKTIGRVASPTTKDSELYGKQMEGLTLSLTPNLRYLFAGAWFPDSLYFPTNLPNLTQFEHGAYWEPDGSPEPVQLENLVLALNAMPNLVHLNLSYIEDWSSSVKLQHVTWLDLFYSNLNAQNFKQMICDMPNLVHLKCEQLYIPNSFLAHLGSALQPCRKTLKTFILESVYDEGPNGEHEDEYEEGQKANLVVIGSFKQMLVLEEIKLPIQQIPGAPGNDKCPRLKPGSDLVDILPVATKKFALDWWFVEESFQLLADKASTLFPSLTEVAIQPLFLSGDKLRMEAVAQQFKEKDITFRIY